MKRVLSCITKKPLLFVLAGLSAFLIILTMNSSTAFASENFHDDPSFIEAAILDLDNLPEGNSVEERINKFHEENEVSEFSQLLASPFETRDTTVITAYIIRLSGTSCQLYIRWAGVHSINTWRASNVRVTSTSLLNPATYMNANNFYRSVTAGAAGSAYVGTMSIPTSQAQARVNFTNLQAYFLAFGWRSAVVNNGTANIN